MGLPFLEEATCTACVGGDAFPLRPGNLQKKKKFGNHRNYLFSPFVDFILPFIYVSISSSVYFYARLKAYGFVYCDAQIVLDCVTGTASVGSCSL